MSPQVLGCELLKVLNVLDLGLNMDILEEQMLHEILCTECPKFENRWQNLQTRAFDTLEAVEAAEVLRGPLYGLGLQGPRYGGGEEWRPQGTVGERDKSMQQ